MGDEEGGAPAYVRLDGEAPEGEAGRESRLSLWSSFAWRLERSGSAPPALAAATTATTAGERERPAAAAAEEATWGSLNYDDFVNDVSIREKRRWRPKRRVTCFGYSGRTLARWVVTCGIGVGMGAVAIALAQLTEGLIEWRKRTIERTSAGLCVYVAINCVLAFASAALAVVVAPGAEGSGIPVVKAYLNGVRMRGCLSVRVFLVKFFGTALSVGSGASLGPEGPLVHLGAIMGSRVAGRRCDFAST